MDSYTINFFRRFLLALLAVTQLKYGYLNWLRFSGNTQLKTHIYLKGLYY